MNMAAIKELISSKLVTESVSGGRKDSQVPNFDFLSSHLPFTCQHPDFSSPSDLESFCWVQLVSPLPSSLNLLLQEAQDDISKMLA
jgi:hypothetical protein